MSHNCRFVCFILLLAAAGVIGTGVAHAEPLLVIGTNTPADAAALNAAIAASPEGSEIVLRGKFLLNQTIRLLGHRSYRGESRGGTLLRQADGANLPALLASSTWLDNNDWTGTPLEVRNLRLDGNRKANPEARTIGLVLRSWLSVVQDVHICDMGGDGLRLTSVSANGTRLKNTQVNGRITDCFIEGSGGHGVNVEDPGNSVTDWTLSDNWIAGSGLDGIHLDNAAGWVVERNHLYGVPHHAIYAHRLFATSISDNYLEGFGETDEQGTWCGIQATLQGDATSTIQGNRLFCFGKERQAESSYRYVSLTVNYGQAVLVLTGNAIRGAGTERGTGLHCAAAGERALKLIATGNTIDNVKTPRLFEGAVTVSAGE